MTELDFDLMETRDKYGEVFVPPPPNLLTEKAIAINTDAAEQIGSRLGARPSRASLSRWRTYGYPVDRNGPRVRMPYISRMKKVYTTTAALGRWLRAVQYLAEEVQAAGGVREWRASRTSRRG